MLFLEHRDRRETHRDTPSPGYPALLSTSASRDPARGAHAETHSPSSFRQSENTPDADCAVGQGPRGGQENEQWPACVELTGEETDNKHVNNNIMHRNIKQSKGGE